MVKQTRTRRSIDKTEAIAEGPQKPLNLDLKSSILKQTTHTNTTFNVGVYIHLNCLTI